MAATSTSNSPSPAAVVDRVLSPKLKFTGSDRFIRELRRRVDAYFEQTGRRRRSHGGRGARAGEDDADD